MNQNPGTIGSPRKYAGTSRVGKRGSEGNSRGVTLPKEPVDVAEFLGLQAGDLVVFLVDEQRKEVVLVNPKRGEWTHKGELLGFPARVGGRVQEDEPLWDPE